MHKTQFIYVVQDIIDKMRPVHMYVKIDKYHQSGRLFSQRGIKEF